MKNYRIKILQCSNCQRKFTQKNSFKRHIKNKTCIKRPYNYYEVWSKKDLNFLINNYGWGNINELIKKLNRKWNAIQHKANKMKIKRIRKGNCDIIRILGNNFNYTITNYGYMLISNPKLKISMMMAHRYIWEQANKRKIPKKHYIHHKDGNKLNNNISNLNLIKSTEHQNIGGITRIAKECFKIADTHGFWKRKKGKPYRNVGEALCLIISEVSEAFESYRKNPKNKEHFTEELADVLIRLLDFSYGMDLHIETALYKKIKINKKRPYKHGKKF